MTKTETYILFIQDNLRKGLVHRRNHLAKFVKKFQTTDRTFDRYWKIAQERHSIERGKLEIVKEENHIELEKEADKRDILNKIDTLEILTKIAKDDKEYSKERIKAMEVISKIEGWQVTKVAQTDTEGNDLPATVTTIAQLVKY